MTFLEDLLANLKDVPRIPTMSPVDVLKLPDPLGRVIGRMTRQKCLTLDELAQELDIDRASAQHVASLLVEKGYVAPHKSRADAYCANLARMRCRNIPDF